MKIEKVKSFKYLGMHVDDKLSWTEHISTKIESASKLMFKLKSYIGKTWGPSPKMTLYAYTSSIRPQIAYGSFAFAANLTKHAKSKLKAFQRKMLMSMGPFRDNTPGDALEVLFDVPPLDLFLLGESRKANYRLKPNFDKDWSGQGKGKKLGHIRQAEMDEKEMDIPRIPCDKIDSFPLWEKRYSINNSKDGDDKYQGFRCYTDGSKTRHGVGSGSCAMIHTYILKTRAYGLQDYCTVFQAELYAIKRSCALITDILDQPQYTEDPDFKKVLILSDSQAALLALDKIDTDSRLVLEVKEALNALCNRTDVELSWIKAHVNYKGNEMADRLAKTGTKLMATETVGPGRTTINGKITQHIYSLWNERWQSAKGYRQSKLFMPNVFNRGRGKKSRELSRHDIGILVRNITGHAFLRKHNQIIEHGYHAQTPNEITPEFLAHIDNAEVDEVSPSPLEEVDLNSGRYAVACRKCRAHTSVETPYHLIAECEATWKERASHMRTYHMNDIQNWKPTEVVAFFKELNLED